MWLDTPDNYDCMPMEWLLNQMHCWIGIHFRHVLNFSFGEKETFVSFALQYYQRAKQQENIAERCVTDDVQQCISEA